MAVLLAGGGCGSDSTALGDPAGASAPPAPLDPDADHAGAAGDAPSPQTPVDLPVTPPVESPSALVPIDGCSRELPACEAASAVPCTVRCATRSDGCTLYSEFIPLGSVEQNYSLALGAIDPAGEWLFYNRSWNGGRYDETPYRWSAAEGVVLLSEGLGVPPASSSYESMVVREVRADGGAILMRRIETEEPGGEGYLWARGQGLTALHFTPDDMSADGSVVVGVLGGHAVIWDRERGTRRLDGGSVEAALAPLPGQDPPPFFVSSIAVSDSGELALATSYQGRDMLWSDAQGLTPVASLPGFPAGASIVRANLNGPELLMTTGDVAGGPEPLRLWLWSEAEGARALGALPGLPPDLHYTVYLSSADDRVIVGKASSVDGLRSVMFRWSRELGMQRISDGKTSTPQYLSRDGSTLLGYNATNGSLDGTFRWTASDGMRLLPAASVSGIAMGGDLLLARVWDGTEAHLEIEKFGKALELGGTLPIEIIEFGLLPEGFEDQAINGISDNGRLIAGSARGADGGGYGWLLRLHDTCDP